MMRKQQMKHKHELKNLKEDLERKSKVYGSLTFVTSCNLAKAKAVENQKKESKGA